MDIPKLNSRSYPNNAESVVLSTQNARNLRSMTIPILATKANGTNICENVKVRMGRINSRIQNGYTDIKWMIGSVDVRYGKARDSHSCKTSRVCLIAQLHRAVCFDKQDAGLYC